jgi:ribosomal protein S18 acetylase RimI-like enzyme
MSRIAVEELEDAAARAVPAADVAELGGWLLRATPGLTTRRVNSVLARGARTATGASPALAERLAAVEAFYASRGLPARYQLSPASSPDGLAEVLLARGYQASSSTDVKLAPLDGAAELVVPATLAVTLATTAGQDWWRTWSEAAGVDRGRVTAVAELFGRISADTGFACVRAASGGVVAVGMGVRDGRRLGVFNMATLSEHRGRGAGRAALRALAAWGRAQGAIAGYLQVDADNGPARALYRRAGFRSVYEYVYLSQERPGQRL